MPISTQKKYSQETVGVGFTLAATALWGVFPVLVNVGAKQIPPLTFAASSMIFAALGTFLYALTKKSLHEFKIKQAHIPMMLVTLFIVVIPYTLFFIGASKTSGINTTMLLLAEIIFTLIFTHFIGEKTTSLKILGASGVFIGALFILYNGTIPFNSGDLLIIASTITYPFGNFYAKKALNLVSPATILFFRSALGALCIICLALFFEPDALASVVSTSFLSDYWLLILNGLFILGASKIIWYEGLKRLDISKTISLAMAFPLFSLVILLIFFHEVPTIYQFIGIALMLSGVYFSIRRKSVDPQKTLYRKTK